MPKVAKKKGAGSPRIRPECVKERCLVMLWPDYREVLAELGDGSISGGIALLVQQHLQKSQGRRSAA